MGLINQGGHSSTLKEVKGQDWKDVDVTENNPVCRCMRTYIQVMPEAKEKSEIEKAGFIMPDNEKRHKNRIMTVIRCGEYMAEIEGVYRSVSEVNVGDRVLVAELGKVEFEVDGKFVYFVEASNIIAVLN